MAGRRALRAESFRKAMLEPSDWWNIEHVDITCDSCEAEPIVGQRHAGYDLLLRTTMLHAPVLIAYHHAIVDRNAFALTADSNALFVTTLISVAFAIMVTLQRRHWALCTRMATIRL